MRDHSQPFLNLSEFPQRGSRGGQILRLHLRVVARQNNALRAALERRLHRRPTLSGVQWLSPSPPARQCPRRARSAPDAPPRRPPRAASRAPRNPPRTPSRPACRMAPRRRNSIPGTARPASPRRQIAENRLARALDETQEPAAGDIVVERRPDEIRESATSARFSSARWNGLNEIFCQACQPTCSAGLMDFTWR